MKYCPNCNALYGDDLLMCPNCNCELKLKEATPTDSENAGTGTAQSAGAGTAQGQRAQNNSAKGTDYANGSNGKSSAGSANTRKTQTNTTYQTNNVYYRGPRVLPFYEKTWFIVLCFFCCWPVAIGLIILRIRRNEIYNSAPMSNAGTQFGGNAQAGSSQTGSTQAGASGNASAGYEVASTQGSTSGSYMRGVPAYIPTGKSGVKTTWRLVVGIFLLICGCSYLPDAWHGRYGSDFGSTCAALALFLCGGAFLTVQALIWRSDCAKFDPLVDHRGNTRLSFLASTLNMPESKVRSKLQTLIRKGFLAEPNNGISAYISGEYNLLVVTWNGNPIVPIEQTMKDEMVKKQAEAEKARRSAPMDIEDRYHLVLEDNIASITDEEVARSLKGIDRSIRNICMLTKSNEDLRDNKSIQNMKAKYIPKAVEYIERYVKPTTSDEMKERLKNMFATLDEAFENIEEQIVRRDEFGTDIELDVLKNTLASEGVLDSDFDLNGKM